MLSCLYNTFTRCSICDILGHFLCSYIILQFILSHSKVLDDCPGDLSYWYRHISKGAWPFSTADHGWPISDCAAEGLKVLIEPEKKSSLALRL